MTWQKKTGTSSLLRKMTSDTTLVSVSASPTPLERKTPSPSAFAESVQTASPLIVLAPVASTLLPRTPGSSGLENKTPFWYALVVTEELEQVTASDGSYVIVGDEYLKSVVGKVSAMQEKTQGVTAWQRH
jgi:hypothetical protein